MTRKQKDYVSRKIAVDAVEIVGKTLGIPPQRIVSASRREQDAFARHIVTWWLKHHALLKRLPVAHVLNRDRSTVTKSEQVANALLSVEDERFCIPFKRCLAALNKYFKDEKFQIKTAPPRVRNITRTLERGAGS